MSKLDDVAEYIREQLSGYIGQPNSEATKENMVKSLTSLMRNTATKFDKVAVQVGDAVEVKDVVGGILDPDDMNKSLYDAQQGKISFTYIMPGTPLLVLATTGRGIGNIRVLSAWSGEVGWIHSDYLRPF